MFRSNRFISTILWGLGASALLLALLSSVEAQQLNADARPMVTLWSNVYEQCGDFAGPDEGGPLERAGPNGLAQRFVAGLFGGRYGRTTRAPRSQKQDQAGLFTRYSSSSEW